MSISPKDRLTQAPRRGLLPPRSSPALPAPAPQSASSPPGGVLPGAQTHSLPARSPALDFYSPGVGTKPHGSRHLHRLSERLADADPQLRPRRKVRLQGPQP